MTGQTSLWRTTGLCRHGSYDYYFRKSEIWLFAIWLIFEKNWKNITICNMSDTFSFDDSIIICIFAGKTSFSGAILASFLLAVEV